MEPVTHFMTGACLGRSGLNRTTAYATLAMTLAAEAPDLDVLWGLRGPVSAFAHHRGITHTLLGAPFVALAVTAAVWIVDRLRRKPPPLPPRWFLIWLFSLLAVLSHLLLDWTNNYGIRPFFPFNPRWYELDLVSIFEPVLFAALLLGLLLPAILGLADREIGVPKSPFRGRGWAIAALVIVVLDWSVRAAEHHRALALIGNTAFGSESMVRDGAEPYPGNPFHWLAVVETSNYYQLGSVDTLTDEVLSGDHGVLIFKPPVTEASIAAKRSRLGQVYLDWAEFPLVADRGPANLIPSGYLASHPLDLAIEFRDLRFAYPIAASGRAGTPTPLTAWVYVTAGGTIDAMAIGERVQK